MTKTFSNFIAALLLAALPHAVQSADWPQRRGIGNDGISAETSWVHAWPKEGPPILWKASVGTGFSSITVAQGSAYTMGNTGEVDSVFCLSTEDGSIRWKFSYDEPLAPTMYEGGPNSTPTIDGTALYVASRSGRVFRLDARSGKEVWRRNLEEYVGQKNGKWGVGGSPLVVGSRLYINYGAAVVALDAASGQPIWQSAREPKSETSFNTPVFAQTDGDKVLFALMNEALFAVSADDGKVLCRHGYGSGYKTHCSDVVVTPEGVFISSGDDGGELLALEKSKPRSLWKNKNLSTFTGSPVLVGGHLFGVNAAGYKKGKQELRCIELAKGEVKWALPEFGQDSLIAAGDRLLVLKERGELLVIRATPERGEILARAQVLGGKCWTQPALSGGLLYCRNAKGQVVCVDLRPAKT
jgi:outer membrane protein assembly factor BamB